MVRNILLIFLIEPILSKVVEFAKTDSSNFSWKFSKISGTVIFINTSKKLIPTIVLSYVYNRMNVMYAADGLEKRILLSCCSV